ncbi:MAG: hypothetical protein AAFY60_07740 [Myxococcota bacterium]
MILFGGCGRSLVGLGCDPTSVFGDTWSYDGIDWTELTPVNAPPARFSHAMEFDRARGVVVLYGGNRIVDGERETLGDTWEFDGTEWREIVQEGESPAPRNNHDLVYEPVLGATVLFGGFDFDLGSYNDTWLYAEGRWRALDPVFRPNPRRSFGMTYDASARGVFVYGGQPRDPGRNYLFQFTSSRPSEVCERVGDEDGDGLADCDDPDCAVSARCDLASGEGEVCRNGLDDDNDGDIDCADTVCGGALCGENGRVCRAGECSCPGGSVEFSCADGLDNDCDGRLDLDDPDCAS